MARWQMLRNTVTALDLTVARVVAMQAAIRSLRQGMPLSNMMFDDLLSFSPGDLEFDRSAADTEAAKYGCIANYVSSS